MAKPIPVALSPVAFAAAAAVLSGAALAQDPPPDWQPVTTENGVELQYDSETVLQMEDGIRVRTRRLLSAPRTLPQSAGAAGEYSSEVQIIMLDCDAREYSVTDQAWFYAGDTELGAVTVDGEAAPYEPGSGIDMIAARVCPLPVTPEPATE